MYLSRLTLQPFTDIRQFIRTTCLNRYREHQALWELFDLDPAASRDFLYRQEFQDGVLKYFLVSQRKPVDAGGIWRIESKEYAPRLQCKEKLAFVLRVNPVVTRKDSSGRAKRHDVVMDEKKRIGYKELPENEKPPLQFLVEKGGYGWLAARSRKCGFAVSEKEVRIDGYQQHRYIKKGQKHPIQYSTLDFTGLLTITKLDDFKATLFSGIGKARAFGCGLMLVRRL